jgi:MYXO-CTERM domain-containing protein
LEPRAAAHAAALAFDLGCLLVLWQLGGVLLAYLWAAYPFTLLVSASGANDSLVALLVLGALLAWRRPVACGALTALAGLTKLAPLALAPLMVGRRPAAIAAFAAVLVVALAPFDVGTMVDRTLGFQADRDSPFSIWGAAEPMQLAVQVGAAALAVAVAFVPRRRDLRAVAALAAAVLIAAQLGADHWFYLYLVWFAPLTWIAVLGAGVARSPRPPAAASR